MSYGPRGRDGRPAEGIQAPINIVDTQVSFDREAFMHAIRTHGINVDHYRAIPDPVGMASKGDNHAVQTGHVRSNSDGFIYDLAGTFRALFTSNGTSENQTALGAIAFSTAYATPHDYYEDQANGEKPTDMPVLLTQYDRLYIKDIEARVVHTQYVEATSTGIDKLQYPATCVEFVKDANGARYYENKDFEITPEGHIRWTGQNRPGWNIKLGRGTVYSIRYRYTPFFVVARLIHEVRVANVTNPLTLEREVVRMPYQAQLVRENVFYDTNSDPNRPVPTDDRYGEAPSPGGLTGPDPSGLLGPKHQS